MGFEDVFNTVKTQILSMASTFTLGHAYHLVTEDEHERLISVMHKLVIETTTFQAQSAKYSGEDQKVNKKERPKCDHCQKIGHT